MKVTALDFETFYDKDYSLKKMTPVEYVLDPRFEGVGMAVREGHPSNNPTYWVDGPDLPRWFEQADPNGIYVSHNALFDMCVAAWRYNFVPRVMSCTLSIARATLGHCLRSLSLASVSQHLGLGVKGDTVLKVMGMRRDAIIAHGLMPAYSQYSMHDADLCMGIFDKLVRGGEFPVGELAMLDMVLRAAVKPRFQLDLAALAEHKHNVVTEKQQLMQRAGVNGDDRSSLMSNDQFAALLRDLGVEPPTKTSPVTGKVTYAFAKSDPDFVELQEHDDPMVQALVAARLGVKSTLEETRTERLIRISQCDWPGQGQARLMPVPLRFSGAHTHRLSGDWKLNLQNLPTRGGQNAIRRALIAGPDQEVVTVDASQIEARIVAWICQQLDLVEQFARGEDVYSSFASDVFEQPVNRKNGDPEHEAMGFVGKTGILGLGFGVGWVKFQRTVKVDSRKFLGRAIELSDEQAAGTVNTYRRRYSKIPEAWKALNDVGIPVLARGGNFTFGPCEFTQGSISLPSGLRLKYHDLEHTAEGWKYTYGHKRKKLYGASLLENIVQALARITTMDAGLRIQKHITLMDLWLNLQAHDELGWVVPTDHAPVVRAIALEEMCRRPSWAPDLPLAAEASKPGAKSYGQAK